MGHVSRCTGSTPPADATPTGPPTSRRGPQGRRGRVDRRCRPSRLSGVEPSVTSPRRSRRRLHAIEEPTPATHRRGVGRRRPGCGDRRHAGESLGYPHNPPWGAAATRTSRAAAPPRFGRVPSRLRRRRAHGRAGARDGAGQADRVVARHRLAFPPCQASPRRRAGWCSGRPPARRTTPPAVQQSSRAELLVERYVPGVERGGGGSCRAAGHSAPVRQARPLDWPTSETFIVAPRLTSRPRGRRRPPRRAAAAHCLRPVTAGGGVDGHGHRDHVAPPADAGAVRGRCFGGIHLESILRMPSATPACSIGRRRRGGDDLRYPAGPSQRCAGRTRASRAGVVGSRSRSPVAKESCPLPEAGRYLASCSPVRHAPEVRTPSSGPRELRWAHMKSPTPRAAWVSGRPTSSGHHPLACRPGGCYVNGPRREVSTAVRRWDRPPEWARRSRSPCEAHRVTLCPVPPGSSGPLLLRL